MVKLEIVVVGKSKNGWLDEAVAHYEKFLSKYARIKWTVVTSPAKLSALSPTEIKRQEADKLEKILADSYLIALADRGKRVDSITFSRNLEKLAVRSRNEIKIVIGGPYGLDNSILKKSKRSLVIIRTYIFSSNCKNSFAGATFPSIFNSAWQRLPQVDRVSRF